MFSFTFYLFGILLSYLDFKFFRVPNILLATLFILLVLFGLYEQQLNIYSFGISILVLLFFVLLILINPKMILGGGDIKFMMVIAIYLQPILFPYFLIVTGVFQATILIIKQKVYKRKTAPMVPMMVLAVIVCEVLYSLNLIP